VAEAVVAMAGCVMAKHGLNVVIGDDEDGLGLRLEAEAAVEAKKRR